jgi:hypothetical protein
MCDLLRDDETTSEYSKGRRREDQGKRIGWRERPLDGWETKRGGTNRTF